MESVLDSLIKQAKQENTVNAYLKLYQHYKSSQKYFSAQQTLERCLKSVKIEERPVNEDAFLQRLIEIKESHPDAKDHRNVLPPHEYVIFSLLGEISLILKEPYEALIWLTNAYKNYTDHSEINQKILANVVYSGLIQCFLSISLYFVYLKSYREAMQWKDHTTWLISHVKSSPEYLFTSEKLELMIGNFYFIQFSWYGTTSDFEMCACHVKNIENPEIKFVMAYYTNKKEAKKYATQLVMAQPGISMFWTWLSFVENDNTRKSNAINRALQLDKKNWAAWVALGIFQASNGDFVSASKTWKMAHFLNHLEPQLWVLSAFLYKEAKMIEKSAENFKIASDLDPSIWISIEHYLSN